MHQPTLFLKVQLKQRGITYPELAAALVLSELAVKQMFATGDMNLSRLDRICEILSMDISNSVGLVTNNFDWLPDGPIETFFSGGCHTALGV